MSETKEVKSRTKNEIKTWEALYAYIREHISLTEVVSRHVELKRHSSGVCSGLCPFHPDSSPSFFVYPDGHYHCYGCGAHGDVIEFYRLIHGFSTRGEAALELVREFTGVKPVVTGQVPVSRTEAFTRFCWECWKESARSPEFRDFARQRGYDPQWLRNKWGMGWCSRNVFSRLPPKVVNALKSKGVTPARWCNRVVLPVIRNRKVYSFTGRAFGRESPAKYLNTSGVSKRIPFGLHLAEEHIKKTGKVHIVEGPMDAVRLHSIGVKTAVAVMGSEPDGEQLSTLYRAGAKVFVFIPDGDDTGRRKFCSILRKFASFASRHKDALIRCVLLPDGVDPDEFFKEERYNASSELPPHRILKALHEKGVITSRERYSVINFVASTAPHLVREAANGKSLLASARWELKDSILSEEVRNLLLLKKIASQAVLLSSSVFDEESRRQAAEALRRQGEKLSGVAQEVARALAQAIEEGNSMSNTSDVVKALAEHSGVQDESYWQEVLF